MGLKEKGNVLSSVSPHNKWIGAIIADIMNHESKSTKDVYAVSSAKSYVVLGPFRLILRLQVMPPAVTTAPFAQVVKL